MVSAMPLVLNPFAWQPPRPEVRCIASVRPRTPCQLRTGFAPASVTRGVRSTSPTSPSPASP